MCVLPRRWYTWRTAYADHWSLLIHSFNEYLRDGRTLAWKRRAHTRQKTKPTKQVGPKSALGELPGGLVVRTPHCSGDMGLISGWGIRIPHPSSVFKKTKEKKKS